MILIVALVATVVVIIAALYATHSIQPMSQRIDPPEPWTPDHNSSADPAAPPVHDYDHQY